MPEQNGLEEAAIDLATCRVLVVGCGNLGGALVRSFCRQNRVDPSRLFVCDRNSEKVDALVRELSVQPVSDLVSAVANAEIAILAVKPNVILQVAEAIADGLVKSSKKPLLVSVAAGITLQSLRQKLGAGFSLSRVMPNMGALVGASVSGIYAPDSEERLIVSELFSSIGQVLAVESEAALDALTGLSASGQAFGSVIIEALADGGVKAGLRRDDALRVAAQTMLGAARLILDGGWHPAQLKDAIASPGGTTIAGLQVLEQAGVRGAVMSAVVASADRARELGQK